MSAQLRAALGYAGSQVVFTSLDEVAWVCGNTIVLQVLGSNGQQVIETPSRRFAHICSNIIIHLIYAANTERHILWHPMLHRQQAAWTSCHG